MSLAAAIDQRIDEARAVVRACAQVPPPPGVTDPSGMYLVADGGKFVRPRLLLTAGIAAGADAAALVPLAAAVELVHNASLIHDDILDEAPMRRGKPAAHVSFGTKMAVLGGDYLFTGAFRIVAAQNSPALLGYWCDRINRMVESETAMLRLAGPFDLATDAYWRWIDAKTGALFEIAAATGVLLTGADPIRLEAAGVLGAAVGRLFQLVDDLLDYTAPVERTGKPRFADFRAGKPTLPLLLMRDAAGADAAALRVAFGKGEPDAAVTAVITRALEAGTAARVAAIIEAERARAATALHAFAPSAARDALNEALSDLAARTR